MRILICGDSLGLPRPFRINQYNPSKDTELAVHWEETYGFLLEQWLRRQYSDQNVHLINRSQRFFTIKNVHSQIVDHLFFFEPNVIILHVGIVDCWFRENLHVKQLVDIKEFESYFNQIVAMLRLRPNTKLVIVGIAPTSLKMESRYPGINEEIRKYNLVYKRYVDFHQIFYIDLEQHIDPDDPHVYLLPDDHHLNKDGNKLVCSQLKNILAAFLENEKGATIFHEGTDASIVLQHFEKSYALYPSYVDNLYNLLILYYDFEKWSKFQSVISYIKERDIRHQLIDEIIMNLTRND